MSNGSVSGQHMVMKAGLETLVKASDHLTGCCLWHPLSFCVETIDYNKLNILFMSVCMPSFWKVVAEDQ